MTKQSKPRKTKIVCTLEPATFSPEKIAQLIWTGMDVASLNFSHSDYDTHRQSIPSIRRLSGKLGKEIGILQDFGGPKIRLGELPSGELPLDSGEKVVLSSTWASDLLDGGAKGWHGGTVASSDETARDGFPLRMTGAYSASYLLIAPHVKSFGAM